MTPGARETRRRTILTKNCRVRAPASYAWCVESGERKRENESDKSWRGEGTTPAVKKKRKKETRKRSVKEGSVHAAARDRGTNGRTQSRLSVKRPRHTLLSTESRSLAHSLPVPLPSFFEAPSLVSSKGKWCSFHHRPTPPRLRLSMTRRRHHGDTQDGSSVPTSPSFGCVPSVRSQDRLRLRLSGRRRKEVSQTQAVVSPKFIYVAATVAATSNFCVSLYKVGIGATALQFVSCLPGVQYRFRSYSDRRKEKDKEREKEGFSPREITRKLCDITSFAVHYSFDITFY